MGRLGRSIVNGILGYYTKGAVSVGADETGKTGLNVNIASLLNRGGSPDTSGAAEGAATSALEEAASSEMPLGNYASQLSAPDVQGLQDAGAISPTTAQGLQQVSPPPVASAPAPVLAPALSPAQQMGRDAALDVTSALDDEQVNPGYLAGQDVVGSIDGMF